MLRCSVNRLLFQFCSVIPVLLLAGAYSASASDNDFPTDFLGADANIGERLFLETRFSQYYFTNSAGDANANIPGDPTVSMLTTTNGQVPGPFAGQAMNCRQCHLVDEKGYGPNGDGTLGNRTYADFARHSPIPMRDDGRVQTPRNAQVLVDALIPRNGPLFLHYDGQFASAHDLIIATLTGRNYGWKPDEYQTAVHHIASIIRNDDGMGYLVTQARGGQFNRVVGGTALPGEMSYGNIFSGFTLAGDFLYDPRSLTPVLISPNYWMNVESEDTTDEQILDEIATLMEAYLRNLFFSQDTNGLDFTGNGTAVFNGSPFDVFLIKNQLPQVPDAGETSIEYSHRLLGRVNGLADPVYVTDPDDGEFFTQTQSFTFGPQELEGLKIFLRGKTDFSPGLDGSIGNCAACHSPPAFTDFIFHNTGASQEEYDAILGPGAFQRICIPNYSTRQTNYEAYLPATPLHPLATGRFVTSANTNQPGYTDLGMWNVFANPDFPAPQAGLTQILPQLLGLNIPRISHASTGQQQFTLSGTNGNPGQVYYVLASANPAASPDGWQVVATNVFDSQGNFNFTDNVESGTPQQYYKLSLQMPSTADVLPQMIGRFKTSGLRDLSQSGPYLHTGRMDSLEQVIQFYEQFSDMARQNNVRNADSELSNIHLNDAAVAPLAAFLRALDEDYTD